MLDKALKELKLGRMVLLHDSSDREDEVDMVVHASAVKPATVRRMRKDAGGLICLAIGGEIAQRLSLPYMSDIMAKSNETVRGLIPERTAYGDKPAFSLAINHRDTYTGIPDRDRAKTISEFPKVRSGEELAAKYYAPGHVPLLIARTLSERRGHTELSIELARRAGISPTMVLCEMLADGGGSLGLRPAKAYGKSHRLVFVDGGEL
jgi:3,4-dihydroxy 2-butanone 4-phosphate synthase